MKHIAVTILCICLALKGSAQGLFNQKGEMIKKCIEQIGLLATCTRQAKQGYDIIDKGLKTVNSIKRGEFGLHDMYYTSLKTVNPEIKGFSKVDAAVNVALSISKAGAQTMRLVNSSKWLGAGEKDYLRAVFTKLLDETDKDLQTLTDLITSGNIQLTDDERLKRIEGCCQALTGGLAFCQRFSGDVKMLIAARSNGASETKVIQQFYNLQN